MKRWRANDDHPVPVEVECEQHGYPHKDSDGNWQCENTHFDSEDEAWKNAQRNAEAYVSLVASSVRNAEEQLVNVRERAADATKFMADFIEGRNARQRG